MRKEVLEKRLARLTEKKDELKKKAKASANVDELRALTEALEENEKDITETREELDLINAEERAAEPVSVGTKIPEGAVRVNGKFTVGNEKRKDESVLASVEYRTAFRKFVTTGEQIPAELRTGDAVNVTNNAAVIPFRVFDEVINTYRGRYGNLYAKVRKTTYPGGQSIPAGNLQASFAWMADSAVAPNAKLGDTASITFGLYKAECRLAQTFLSAAVSLESFEAEFAKQIAIAYAKAWDYAIVNGTGNGQPLGILNDTNITTNSGHVISMTEAQFNDWVYWRQNVIAAIPLGYSDGEFIVSKATANAYLETMRDANNNPVYRQATGLELNSGDARFPRGEFFGHEVSLVEPTILADFASASDGDPVAIYWIPDQYFVNEPFGMQLVRYNDQLSDNVLHIARTYADGKPVNKDAFWIITKDAD